MQGFRVTFRGKIYDGTEFIGHGDGSIVELVGTTKEGVVSVLVAPAVLCDVTRIELKSPSSQSLNDEHTDTEKS
jgi:hypothetical protein